MGIWAIIKNLGLIISFFKAASGMIDGVAKEKRSPTKAEVKAMLDSLEDLLDKKVIDVPGVDEEAISSALKVIEEQFCKTA